MKNVDLVQKYPSFIIKQHLVSVIKIFKKKGTVGRMMHFQKSQFVRNYSVVGFVGLWQNLSQVGLGSIIYWHLALQL